MIIKITIFLSFMTLSFGEKYANQKPIIPDKSLSLYQVIKDPFITKNSTEILDEIKFDHEIHTVTTEDGYILKMIRIVNSYLVKKRSELRPVFFLHGMLSNSDFFLTNHYKSRLSSEGVLYDHKNNAISCEVIQNSTNQTFSQSIALNLAACGYDVWLGNFRGNYYSSKHRQLHQTNHQYWSFTLDHLAIHDVPSMVDYILSTTNKDSLAYIAHSMGTTTMFQLMSKRSEYITKIDAFIAFAPVGQMNNDINPIISIFKQFGIDIISSIDRNLFSTPSNEFRERRKSFAKYVCAFSLTLPLCQTYSELMSGRGQQDRMLVPQMFGHFPDTTSVKIVAHYGQIAESNFTVNMFDYGRKNNVRIYGQEKPPQYDFSTINHPKIILISGGKDALATPDNVKYLRDSLPSVYENYVIPNFNHVDFVGGKQASTLFVRWIVERMAIVYPK